MTRVWFILRKPRPAERAPFCAQWIVNTWVRWCGSRLSSEARSCTAHSPGFRAACWLGALCRQRPLRWTFICCALFPRLPPVSRKKRPFFLRQVGCEPAVEPGGGTISDCWSSAALPVLLGPPGLGFSHVDVTDKAHADQDAAKDDEDQHPGHLLVILQLEVHQLASLLERLRLAAENPVRPRARWSEKAAPAKLCRSHALVHRPREALLAAEHAQRLQLLERERVGGDAVRDVLELLEQPLLRPGSSVEHSQR